MKLLDPFADGIYRPRDVSSVIFYQIQPPISLILTKIIKDNIDIFTPILHQEFNKSLKLGKFWSEMELAGVTSAFKKEDWTEKKKTIG